MSTVIRITVMVVFAGVSFCSAAGRGDVLRYQLNTVLEPQTGRVSVAGEVIVGSDLFESRRLSFLLHETFEVSRLAVEGQNLDFESRLTDRIGTRPASRRFLISLPSDIRTNPLRLEFSYSGKLKVLPEFGTPEAQKLGFGLDDVVNAGRVELASYSSWYPQIVPYGVPFDFELKLSTPSGWTIVANAEGTEHEITQDVLATRWNAQGVLDIVVVGSPQLSLTSISGHEYTVEIYASQLPDWFIAEEAKEIRETLGLFEKLLGHPKTGQATVRHVFSPRDAGQGGYAREPMIVTSEGRILKALEKDPNLSLLRGIAHEIGHFWWSFGRGQGDWINEAFAEYFSLVAVEKIVSRQELARRIQRYRRAVHELPSDAPPLSQVPPSNVGHGYVVRYFKGALFLHFLRREVGDDEFWRASRKFYDLYRSDGATTDEFRAFWGDVLKKDAAMIDEWLDAPGGLPAVVDP